MGVGSIPKCLGVEIENFDFSGFKLVLDGFVASIPELMLLIPPKVLPPDMPSAALKIILGNLKGLPPFSVDVDLPGLGKITLKVGDPKLAIPGFSPGNLDVGLISFVVGFVSLGLKIPQLVIDGKFPGDLTGIIVDIFGFGPPAMDIDFALKLSGCIAKAIIPA